MLHSNFVCFIGRFSAFQFASMAYIIIVNTFVFVVNKNIFNIEHQTLQKQQKSQQHPTASSFDCSLHLFTERITESKRK